MQALVETLTSRHRTASAGIKHFRLSVSWPRIFPSGTGEPNQEGLAFYGRLLDALLAAGIEPHVTLYHWDLPQALMVRM